VSARRFGPKTAGHPSIGTACPICKVAFAEGDFTTLLTVAPADEEEAAKKAVGLPYTAQACEVHWDHVEDL
jgi:hypothetical protein